MKEIYNQNIVNLIKTKKYDTVVSTHELGNIVLETGQVPTPIYKDRKIKKKTKIKF